MNFTKYKKWVAILAVLALAVSLPAAALAADDTTAPVVSLYSPSGTSAAATANQKIIFSLSEKVTLVGGKSITVSDDTTTYTANASAGTLVGDALTDSWYAVYKLSDFVNGATPLTLALSTPYTVNAEAGAFADLAATPNVSAAASGSFTTVADGTQFAVVFTTATSGQSATAGGSAIVSGQAVASGTTVAFNIPAQAGYDLHTAVKVNGASGSFNLAGAALTGDLEVYITRSAVTALGGTPVISGNATVGSTLSANLSGINQPDLSGITLKWIRVDGATETQVATGTKDATYTLTADDLGKTIRLDVTDATLTGTVSATTAAITKAPYSGTVTKPAALTVTDTTVLLQSVSGYEYMITGGSWQDSTTFSGLTSGATYDFFQRVKETGTTLASDTSEKATIKTVTGIAGTAVISGTVQSGKTLTGSLSGSTSTGTISYVWQRGGATVGTTATYLLGSSDVGQVITLYVTASDQSGTLSTATAAVLKAENTTVPAAPTMNSATATSIILNTISGYQYSLGGSNWQDSTTFSGLTTGTSYDFYQRVKETSTTLASATSDKTTIKTVTGIAGTAVISGTVQSGKTLTGSLSGSTSTGTISYVWQRGGATVGTGATYLLSSADVGQVITLYVSASDQSGTLSAATAAVLKAENTTVPAAPTMNSATATTITLNTISGYQYSLGGSNWQDTTTFHNLVAGAAYTFYQRVAETTTVLASAPSASVNFSTLPALSGTISTIGEARYGMTMTASLSGSNNTGTLTYTWKRGNTVAGTGTSYAVIAADIGNQLSLEVTSSVQGGIVSKSLGTVAKAYFVGDAPDAPTRYSRTTSKIVLNSVDGCEYSRGGTTWQDSTTFSGLKSGTSYTFYQRYKATATTEASPSSAAYKTSTSASSSTSDDSSATTTPKPSATDDATSTALYSYTLTQDNTRILYSTMKSLAEGNKTKDVTIKQDDVEFTFPKGTMTQSYTQLWYDFGTTINNSIAVQTAQELAGDAYVATVHYNYSGELPGKANIRINVGAAQANKTLYFYLLNDNKTLTFQQTSVVDSTGWATVTQTHCSDYVFLNRDIATVSASPSLSPSPDASASPLPSPTVSPDSNSTGFGSDGWFIAAIILIAVALIVGGIWLYTKNRGDKMDDEDDEF